MKWPGIFVLTSREQRAIILIVLTLLAVAVARRYRDRKTYVAPAPPAPVEMSATPAMPSSDEEDHEPGE
jgi:hypothetical protein